MTEVVVDESPRAAAVPQSPYKGLVPFSEDDEPYFFGRDRERKILVANLRSSRLTLVYGASGVGKSSLLLAGVARHLRDSVRENAQTLDAGLQAPFAVTVFRSWRDPPLVPFAETVRTSVVQAVGGREVPPWTPDEPLVDTLRRWTGQVEPPGAGAVEAKAEAGGPTPCARTLLVVLDQFEEYFLYHPHDTGPDGFGEQFAAIVTAPALRVNVLVSLREDALATLDRFKGRIPRLYENYVRIDHLDRQAARDAIVKPIEEFNARERPDARPIVVAPELVDAILDSEDIRAGQVLLGQTGAGVVTERSTGAQDGRIEAPYLQLVLSRLWERELELGSVQLRKETLEQDLGGPRRIVQSHLDDAMAKLADVPESPGQPSEQEIAAAVFHYLVTPSKTKIAHSATDLADYAKLSKEQIVPVLEKLCAGERILRKVIPPGAEAEDARYEIFHDVLAEAILDWRTRKQAEIEERNRRAAAERDERERRKAAERELDAARIEWDKAVAQAKRDRERAMVLRVLLAVAAVGFALALGFAVWATHQTRTAQTQRKIARSQALAAQSLSELPVDPDASVHDALAALSTKETRQADEALREAFPESRLRAILPYRRDFVTSVGFSPDGKYVATGASDGVARIWNRADRRVIAELPGGKGWTTQAEFSRDGKLVLTSSDLGTILWDFTRCHRVCRRAFTFPPARTFSYAAFSASGKHVVTGGQHGTRVWDVRSCLLGRPTCKPHEIARRGQEWPTAVALSGNGQTLASSDYDGNVSVWAVGDKRRRPLVVLGTSSTVGNIAFNPKGTLLAALGEKEAIVWNLRECLRAKGAGSACQPMRRFPTTDWASALAFSPDGSELAIASQDGRTLVWGLASSEAPMLVLSRHSDAVLDVAFSADGQQLVTASADRTARIWDVNAGVLLLGHSNWISSAEFSRSGDRVVTASRDGTVRIWSRAGRQLQLLRPAGRPSAAMFAAGDSTVISPSDETGYAETWRLSRCCSGTVLRKLGPDQNDPAINAMAVSRTAAIAATADNDGKMRIFSVSDGTVLEKLAVAPGKQVFTVAFSDDGRYLLAAGTNLHVRIWDVGGCTPTKCRATELEPSLPVGAVVYSAVFSPDGRNIVTGSGDGVVRIWSWRGWQTNREPPRRVAGLSSLVHAVAVSPHGLYVAAALADRSVRIWQLATGSLEAVIRIHAGVVNTVRFSPRSDTTILTASDDGTATISRCDTCGSLERLRKLAEQRELAVHPSSG